MPVYGSTILKERILEQKFDIYSYIEESTKSFNNYIDSLMVIKEENDIIVADVPYKEIEDDVEDAKKASDNTIKDAQEKVQKTFFQKVKEIFIKVITVIKDFFKKIYNNIHDMYMNTNLKDAFWSRYKDKVTYPNLEKAKENGWKGLPAKTILIGKIWDTSDSDFFKLLSKPNSREDEYDEYYINDILQYIDKIQGAKDDSELESIMEKIEEWKKRHSSRSKYWDNYLSAISGPILDSQVKYFDNGDINMPFINEPAKAGESHIMPTVRSFAIIKKLAEEGQRLQKDQAYSNKVNLKGIKDEKAVIKSLNANDKKAYEDDPFMQKKLMYELKAKMAYINIYYTYCVNACRTVGRVVSMQYKYSIQAYIKFIMAIRHYVLKEKAAATT